MRESVRLNRNKGRSGRTKTAITRGNIEFVRQSFEENGVFSRRNGLGLGRSSFHRIAKHDVKFHPYELIRRQELREGDPAQSFSLCNRLMTSQTVISSSGAT